MNRGGVVFRRRCIPPPPRRRRSPAGSRRIGKLPRVDLRGRAPPERSRRRGVGGSTADYQSVAIHIPVRCKRRGSAAEELQAAWRVGLLVHGQRGQLSGEDLWVNGQEVTSFDLPRIFARLRHPSRRALPLPHTKAVSADILRTSNAKGGFRISPKTACDLHFYIVAGAGFEPATSGL